MDNKIKMSTHSINSIEKVDNKSFLKGDYWQWGIKNDYPVFLYELFEDSAIHGSIIRSKLNYLIGSGIHVNDEIKSFTDNCNDYADSLQDILEKCIQDYLIYGCFALNIVWTLATDKIKSLYYVDVATLRWNKEKDGFYQNNDWSKGLRKTTQYPVFNTEDRHGSQIYFFNGKSKGLYGVPSYSGAIEDIKASTKISKFHANKISRNQFADLHIKIQDEGYTDEQKELFEDYYMRKFTGTGEGQQSIVFSYFDKDNDPVAIEEIPSADAEGKRYIALREAVRDSIITAHQITSSSLLAIPSPGLSFDSQYAEAYNIFMNVVINPLQAQVLKPFIKLLAINFSNPEITIKSLPVIEHYLTDENIIVQYMTEDEVREDLEKTGRIKNKSYTGTLNKHIDNAIDNTKS